MKIHNETTYLRLMVVKLFNWSKTGVWNLALFFTLLDQIEDFLKKLNVKSTKKELACIKRVMRESEEDQYRNEWISFAFVSKSVSRLHVSPSHRLPVRSFVCLYLCEAVYDDLTINISLVSTLLNFSPNEMMYTFFAFLFTKDNRTFVIKFSWL